MLLGGSPLRLFRIAERARDLVARWRTGAPVGSAKAAQLLARRLVSAGAFSPRPVGAAFGPPDVTVVVPVRDRPAQLDRLLGALDGLACVVVDDASADAGATKEIAERHGARFVGLASNVGPSGARNAGMAEGQQRARRVRRLRLRARGRDGSVRSSVISTTRWWPRWHPGSWPQRPGRRTRSARFEAVRSSLDRGTREGPVRPGSPIPFVPSAALLVRADVVAGPELFDAALRGGEDVDLVWRLAASGLGRPLRAGEHRRARRPAATIGSFLARRAFYGTTAAPLARRHRGTLAPVHLSGWSLAVWVLASARRPVLALTTLAASIGILARRLTGLVRDPVVVATRIAGGGTARSALPALGGLARAWAPALRAGPRLPPHPNGVGADPGAPGSG